MIPQVGLALILVLALAKADFNVQPGDDGIYKGEHPPAAHDDAPPTTTPTPTPTPTPEKQCTLVRQTTPTNPSMCFLEPECHNECTQVPQEKCTPVEDRECQTVVQKVCNDVQEEVCETYYVTQFENSCVNKVDKACNIK